MASYINEVLAKELHKRVIKKFRGSKVCLRFKCNIWATDAAEMELLTSQNSRVKYSLCAIEVCTKYVCVAPLKKKIQFLMVLSE